MTPKQPNERTMLLCTLELPELFNPDHTTRNAPMMKDMESAKVKKAQDEESKKLRAMASHNKEVEPTRDTEKSKVGRENYIKGEGFKQGPQTTEGAATQW